MKQIWIAFFVLLFLGEGRLSLQAQDKSHWINNPLGFSPLNLNKGNAFFVTGAVVTAALLLSKGAPNLEHKMTIYQDAGPAFGYNKHMTDVFFSDLGVLFHTRKWLGVGVELTGFYFADRSTHTQAIGVRPFARFYLLNREKVRLFFESGAGFVWCMSPFPRSMEGDPREGTRQNFTPKYGIGCDFNVYGDLSVLVGVRHLHLSNGGLYGKNRNPGHDSNGFYFGLSYALPNKNYRP